MSGNERITEDFVREHFKKFRNDVTIEEQQSRSSKIKKLLKSASKGTGGGRGYPEFIITVHDQPNFLIVVECKADSLKHESPERDNHADFAVDGVLLYASHLSRGFDVLAIAVSGTGRQKKISHFLHLTNEISPNPIFDSRLLPPVDYVSGYLGNPNKVRQDYNSLSKFISELNTRLHGDKVPESRRALLISAISIALEYSPFHDTYLKESNSTDLADRMVRNYALDTISQRIIAWTDGEKNVFVGIVLWCLCICWFSCGLRRRGN